MVRDGEIVVVLRGCGLQGGLRESSGMLELCFVLIWLSHRLIRVSKSIELELHEQFESHVHRAMYVSSKRSKEKSALPGKLVKSK